MLRKLKTMAQVQGRAAPGVSFPPDFNFILENKAVKNRRGAV